MTSDTMVPMRFDTYSVGEYGETVCVFRWEPSGPFYSEIQGKRKVIKLPKGRRIRNAKDARQWARDKHKDLRDGPEPEHSLSALFALYLEHRSPIKATAQGRKDDQRRVKMWERFFGPTADPREITKGDLERFIQRRGLGMIDSWGRSGGQKPARAPRIATALTGLPRGARRDEERGSVLDSSLVRSTPPTVRPRTVHADIQWLRAAIRWGTGACTLPPITLRDIARDLHQTAEPRRPVATQDRYEAIMKYLQGLDYAAKSGVCGAPEGGSNPSPLTSYGYLREILVLVNGTGHRLSEILSLQWADIDLDAKPFGAIRWRADAVGNKARIERTVEINPAVRAALDTIQRQRPSVGAMWLFPRIRRPRGKREEADAQPIHRSVADGWLRKAEKAAKLQPLSGSLWHAYRRKWATEKKHLPAADVAAAGGWKNARTLQNVYQQADPSGILRVVLDASELREERNA